MIIDFQQRFLLPNLDSSKYYLVPQIPAYSVRAERAETRYLPNNNQPNKPIHRQPRQIGEPLSRRLPSKI